MKEDEIEAQRRRRSDLEVLYDTVRDLSSTLSVGQVLDRLMDRTLRHLDAEIGSILLIDSDSVLRVVLSRGLPEDVAAETRMAVGEGISGTVAATGRSLLIADVEVDPRFGRRNHERYYTNSLISCPLLRTGTVFGVVNVNNKRNQAPFEEADLQLLDAIAGHAAVALSNARQYEETLRRAQRDSLTGLANHGYLHSTLEREVERAHRYGRKLAVAMIDIDHFKRFNDRFGHPAGDDALVQVAEAIDAISRVHDLVARYGGEEFMVVLPETPLDGAVAFAEKARQAVESAGFGPDGTFGITISVGVTELLARDADAAALVADAQLYRAKSLGRNRVCHS